EKITQVVEGESLINDGTCIVVFATLDGMFVEKHTFSIGSFLGEFLLVSLGGVVLGVLAGWLMSKIVHFTHDRRYQVMLSIILAYGTFNNAEYLVVSGVLATDVAILMLTL